MIADPTALGARDLDRWACDLDNYGITDAFAALVKKTPHAYAKMKKWTKSKREWTGQAGWQLLSHLAQRDDSLPNDFFVPYLATTKAEIHTSKNRVRHSMNGALIAIGLRNPKLEKKVLKIAKAIGKVEVDHGQTSCKTPDAAAYIAKAKARSLLRIATGS